MLPVDYLCLVWRYVYIASWKKLPNNQHAVPMWSVVVYFGGVIKYLNATTINQVWILASCQFWDQFFWNLWKALQDQCRNTHAKIAREWARRALLYYIQSFVTARSIARLKGVGWFSSIIQYCPNLPRRAKLQKGKSVIREFYTPRPKDICYLKKVSSHSRLSFETWIVIQKTVRLLASSVML